MEPQAIAHNLRVLRAARNLSQAEVAAQANLSRVAYGSIESGTVLPRLDNLARLAQVLGVTVEALLKPVRVLKAVRFRDRKKMTARQQLLVDVARRLDDYRELEELLQEHRPYALEDLEGPEPSKRLAPSRAIDLAKRARNALQIGPDGSIRDICGLLGERGGVKVLPIVVASDAFFGLSVSRLDGGPAVVVNVWERISVERWIFTAAHELGHLLLHLGAYNVSSTEENDEEESEANQFASHFLMPDALFMNEWNEARGLPLIERVFKIKRIFRVSYQTVLYRLSENPAYGSKIWPSFQVAFKARFGSTLPKSVEPRRLTAKEFNARMVEAHAAGEPKRLTNDDFVEDRLSNMVRRALEKKAIGIERAAQILELDIAAMKQRIASWVA